MRIVTVVGARPQFIKAAPLSEELRKEHCEYLVHTGQHYDKNMSDVFFHELGIPEPDVHLGVGSGSHAEQTAAMLCGIERVLLEQRPDAVIVFGDTNSTVAGALAAAKLHIPVAHIEAGLRSFNRDMPEEINRILTDHMATWLFAPSDTAVTHLCNEGISAGVHNAGDIMADSVRLFAPRASASSKLLQRHHLEPKKYFAATVHRAANTDCGERLLGIINGLRNLQMPVVLPLHPRTRAAAARHVIELGNSVSNHGRPPKPGTLLLLDPLGYLDMLQLQQHAAMVLTDSGGIQKEAYFLGVPCVTLRDETEWPETVEAGWNCLAGVSAESISDAARGNPNRPLGPRPDIYGDGFAARKIVATLTKQ